MSSKLSKLKREARKLQESDSYPKGAGVITSKDNHSAEPNNLDDKQGVQNERTPKAFDPKGSNMTGAGKTSLGATVKQVDRQEGSAAGKKEVGEEHGSKSEVEKAKPVGREEGSAAGKKEVGEFHDLGGFRQKVRSAFGLPLDDAKNKGNNGIGKAPAKTGSPDSNA